ncbi:MAG: hypothetical protein FJ403_20930 [Verrucomicrobia bacterium]|nr:hypothetical protein [Verrucomicrobiota bacterium]
MSSKEGTKQTTVLEKDVESGRASTPSLGTGQRGPTKLTFIAETAKGQQKKQSLHAGWDHRP